VGDEEVTGVEDTDRLPEATEETNRVLAMLAEHFKTEAALQHASFEAFTIIKGASQRGQMATLEVCHVRALDFIFRSISIETKIPPARKARG
jgi:hypothetical protein